MLEGSIHSADDQLLSGSNLSERELEIKLDDGFPTKHSEDSHKAKLTSPLQETVTLVPAIKGILKMKQSEADAFRLMNKTMVDRCNISINDKFDFENRLRTIVGDLLKPVYVKLTSTLSDQNKLKIKIDK